MNNGCYRIVFNRALGVLQVVSELATAHAGGRSGPRRSLRPHRLSQACALLLATGLAAVALPASAVTCVPDATHLCGTVGGTGGAGTTGGASGAGGVGSVGSGTYANNGGAGGSAYGNGSPGQGAGGSGGAPGPSGLPGAGGAGGGVGTQGNGGGGGGGGSFGGFAGGGGGGGGSAGQYVGGTAFLNPGSIYGGDGGNGGNGAFSGPGSSSAYGGGGGGGGSGIYSNAGSLTSGVGGIVRGGNGGAGGGGFRGASGGGGGTGIAGFDFSLDNAGGVYGGTGGAGGGQVSDGGFGGAGGAGGSGIAGSGLSLLNTGTIGGGAGGAGSNDTFAGGSGGAGGAGVSISGSTLANYGTIAGGSGGSAGVATSGGYFYGALPITGAGGVGVVSNGNTWTLNHGTIAGGLSGDGATRADAILFTGTGNGLQLFTGSNIVGNLELWDAAQATIAAQDAGLGLGSNIVLGNGATLDLDASTAGLDITGSITGNGALQLEGANVLGLATVDVASVQQDAINVAQLNGNVRTSGTQTWNGQIDLGADITLTSTGAGDILVAGADGAHMLTVDTAGATTLGNLGQATALTGLQVAGGGSTTLDGNITTTGTQNYTGAVTLGADGVLSSTGGGTVFFGSTLDGAHALTVNTAGMVIFAGQVGSLTALTDLTANVGAFNANSTVNVSGALSITTNGGAITQNGAFTVGGVSSFDAGSNAINLTNAGNDFVGIVNLAGGATQIYDSNNLLLGTLATGDLTATSAGRLGLGDGSIGGNLIATSSAGGIVERGALIVAGTATLDSGTGAITLTDAGNDFQGNVSLTSGGSVDVVDTNDLAVSSLTAGANADVSLIAGGNLTLPVGAIDTGTGDLTLAANGGTLSTPGALSGANVSLTGRDGVILAGDVTGTTVDLEATDATIAQATGALTAATLTGDAGTGTVTLASAGNAIGTLGDFTAGNFSLADSQALAITGNLFASSDITLSDTFGITVTGSIDAGGSTTITGGTALNIGNGGTAGTISGDVVDDGVLNFNHSDDVIFADAISGTGQLQQLGAGTLTLDGDSSTFAGSTLVASGTLLVGGIAGNGATLGGDVDVDAGATLGGHGRIGGDVDLAGGAHLAPGNSIGTLTIGGDLTLEQGAQLDYEFGAPGADFATPGTGDSVVVGGDLTLDGAVLNVTDVGGMGPGLYRIFSWSGTLTEANGGLALGTTPGTDPLQLQTLTGDKQINLIDSAGLTLNFWNGNGLASSTQMGGGDGTWSTTSMNWTDADATTTAAMQPQPGFAIFGGAAGTVTVDNGSGAVSATGLQFASDGYTLQGDTLTLVGNGTDAPVIRVGDGSSDGAGYTATIDNVIAGSDGVAKTDAGTLVLTATNTFSGGLAIEGGELSVSSDGNLGDASNAVTLDGGLLQVTGTAFQSTGRDLILGANGGGFDIVDAANVFTVGQVLDGSGAFLKDGAGTLVLTGADTFTGGTTIGAGTLQLGDGGTTGSIVGDVVDNGTLAFDRSDAVTFAGTIGGSGGIVQQGSGSTILTADNTFTGGTVITGGTLQLGNGGTTGMIAGNVLDNGTLAFDRSDDVAFAGAISGNGAVTKLGGNTLVLDGNSGAFAGSTDVQSGTLVVGSVAGNGAVLGGDVEIDSGATLAGLGAIGGDVVNDGLMSPGMGVGTLTIHGDYTQTADGSLAIDAHPDGHADLVVVDGSASLDGSALILATDGNWNPLTDYTILTAGGNVSGTFGSAISSLVFLDPILSYDAHAVHLSLQRNDISFESTALTPNQRATAAGADTLGFGNAAYDALTTLGAAEAPQAFDALSGEVHASVQTALVEDSRYLRLAMANRLDSARADGNGVWVAGWGHWARDDSDGNAAQLRTDGNGMVAGADAAVGDGARIGVVIGVGRAHARVDDRSSRADVDSRHLGLYGGMALGGLQFQAGAARSWHDIDSRREVAFTGFTDSLRGSQDAHTTQAYIDGRHDFAVNHGTVSPFVNLAHVQVRDEAFTETGGDAALHVAPAHTSRTFATAGVRGAFAFADAWRVQGSVGWSHALGGDASPKVSESFAAGSDTFVISGVPIAANSVAVQAGVAYQATPAFRINASYVGQFASDARDQGANMILSWSF